MALQNRSEDMTFTNQVYLQNFGSIEIEAHGQGKKLWRARAVTKRKLPCEETSQAREDGLQLIIQNQRNFAYLDLDSVQLTNANNISAMSNKCNAFSIPNDGWTLFGLKAKEVPKFITLTNNFQEVKDIRPHVLMRERYARKRPNKGCILQNFHRRLVELYCRIISKKRLRQKVLTFPHVASSPNGLAVLCIMQPGISYIWEYHPTIGYKWKNIDDCKSKTVPGNWTKVFVDKAQIDWWFKQQNNPRVESRIFFNEQNQVSGAIAYTSVNYGHISIMYSAIEKEGENFFFRFFKVSVNLNNLRSRSKGTITYTARLSSAGKHIAIGVNAPFETFVMTFVLSGDIDKEFDFPDRPMQLCQHHETGLSLYDMLNHKNCWIVDIQWIADDTMFAVITNCGSLAVFDANGDSVVISILKDAVYIQPMQYHQIFQKSHDPAPTTDAYPTIRPPIHEYWKGLHFSILWSAKQNMLICSSGKTVSFFSVVHSETLVLPILAFNDVPVEVLGIKEELRHEKEVQINVLESYEKYSEAGDVISPSFLMESLYASCHHKSYLTKNSDLLDVVQKFVSDLPVPYITIRPVRVELSKCRSFPMIPLRYDFATETSEMNFLDNEILAKSVEETGLDENEVIAKVSQSLPDLRILFDTVNGSVADDEHSVSECDNGNYEECVNPPQEGFPISLETTPPFTGLSDDNSRVGTVENELFQLSSKLSLEIPAVPEIQSVIFPSNSTVCKEYKDSSTQVNLSTVESVPGSSPILQERLLMYNSDRKRYRPRCILPLTSPESTPAMKLSIQSPFPNYKPRNDLKPLAMLSLHSFAKFPDDLKTPSQSVIDLENNLNETIAMEAAQRNLDEIMKEKEQEDHLSMMLSKLKENSDLLKNSYDKSKVGPDSTSNVNTNTINDAKSGKIRKTKKQNAYNDQQIKMSKDQLSDETKRNKKPHSGSAKPTLRLQSPKNKSPITTSTPKFVGYDHILPKVCTFNTSYIPKNSTRSNQKERKTFSNNVNSSGPKKANSNFDNTKISSRANNTKISRNVTNDTHNSNTSRDIKKLINKQETTKRKTNGKVKEKISQSRSPFTDDSDKTVEEMTWYNVFEENDENTSRKQISCTNLEGPSLMVQATNKWVSTRAKQPEGFAMISKSGRCVSSRSSSTIAIASIENLLSDCNGNNKTLFENQPKKQVGKIVNMKFNTSSLINSLEQESAEKSSSNIERVDKYVVKSTAKHNRLSNSIKEIVDKPVEQKGVRLVIQDEEIEHIPLRSILCQSGKNCGRRVSFCEPLALYRTISPFQIDEADNPIRQSVFNPTFI